MSLAALMAFYKANEVLIFKVLFVISEYLGADPRFKSNGFVSFIIQQVRAKSISSEVKDQTR